MVQLLLMKWTEDRSKHVPVAQTLVFLYLHFNNQYTCYHVLALLTFTLATPTFPLHLAFQPLGAQAHPRAYLTSAHTQVTHML